MTDDPLVDASSGGVSVSWRELARRLIAYPIWGAIVAVIGYIELVGSGIVTAIERLTSFIGTVVINTVTLPGGAIRASAAETISFVELAGPLAFALAVGMVSIVLVVTWIAVGRIQARLTGGIGL